MACWHLDAQIETSAGRVAAGSAGKGEPLVLAHGWPWSSYAWYRLIPKLTSHYTVYWYDMPGFGQSEKDPKKATSLDVQGEVFVQILQYWGLDCPTVIAHDFGGAITLRAHLLHGCDFQRYVLMNVVAMRPWGSDFFSHVGRHVEAFQGLPDHIHQAIVEAYIQGAIVNEIKDPDFQRLVEPWITPEGAVSFYRQFAQADEKYTAEIEQCYDSIRCPVRILWGVDDPWIPIGRGRALHKFIGKGEFHLMEGIGHLPQLEGPDKVLNSLHNFL